MAGTSGNPLISRRLPAPWQGGSQTAGKKAQVAPDTLEVESTIRIRHLLDGIRGAYYANQRVRQGVTLDRVERADMEYASPDSSRKLVVLAKYLFLEIWMLGLEEKLGEAIAGMEGGGHGRLARTLRRDLETMRTIADLRNRYSAHPTFPLKEAIARVEGHGFARFWQCARRLLLLREDAGLVSQKSGPPSLEGPRQAAAGLPYRLPTSMEIEEATRRHEGPLHDISWPRDDSLEIMRDCMVCIRALHEEFRIALSLFGGSPSAANSERLCNTVYSLKYVVLEMDDFIDRYVGLGLPDEPHFLDQGGKSRRSKRYEKYRNKYSAHRDSEKRVVSLLQLLGSPIMPTLVLDMHEALCLSGRLFPDSEPEGRIRLPTRDEIGAMEGEMCAFRQDLHRWLGDRAAGAEHVRECDRFHAHIKGICGLG